MTAQEAELQRLLGEREQYDSAGLSARAAAAAAAAELAELRERLANAAGLLFAPLAVGGADHAGGVAVRGADPRQLAAQLRAAAASAEATAALEAKLQARLAALSAEALRLSSAAAQEQPPREV